MGLDASRMGNLISYLHLPGDQSEGTFSPFLSRDAFNCFASSNCSGPRLVARRSGPAGFCGDSGSGNDDDEPDAVARNDLCASFHAEFFSGPLNVSCGGSITSGSSGRESGVHIRCKLCHATLDRAAKPASCTVCGPSPAQPRHRERARLARGCASRRLGSSQILPAERSASRPGGSGFRPERSRSKHRSNSAS